MRPLRLHRLFTFGTELPRRRPVEERMARGLPLEPEAISLSCGRNGHAAAIPERFSSSSLPPSFAQGRRTTAFIPQGTAAGGALRLSGAGA